jgi:hypothetical protein
MAKPLGSLKNSGDPTEWITVENLTAIGVSEPYVNILAKVKSETSSVHVKTPLARAPLACTFLSGTLSLL